MMPFIGFVVGYVFAFADYYGILENWQLVGKLDDNISQIIGVEEGGKLYVSTEKGDIYSLKFGQLYSYGFNYHGAMTLAPQISWEKEQPGTFELISPRRPWYPDFITMPPLFRVKQLYELEYVYRIEGKGEAKYALAGDGSLWMWNHETSGLSGLILYFCPFMGFIAGITVMLLIRGVKNAHHGLADEHTT
jgi:hypothetical protein